jgi:YVTN family beta-propeller protein
MKAHADQGPVLSPPITFLFYAAARRNRPFAGSSNATIRAVSNSLALGLPIMFPVWLQHLASFVLFTLATATHASVAVVLNSGDGTVSLVDKVQKKEISRTYVGKEPHHLIVTPDGSELIVANAASNDLVMLDPKTGAVKRRVSNISDPYQLAYSPDNRWFVSVSLRLDRVDIYSANDLKLVKRIPLGKTPSHVAFDAKSQFAFVTLQESHEIAAIDLKTFAVAWKVAVGKQPAGIMVTPDDKHVLVGVMGEDYIAVVDWRERKLVRKVTTGKGAHNFRAQGDGKHVWVTNRDAGSISLLDYATLSVKDVLKVPGGPDCMEITADGKQLWVTTRWRRTVSVIDIASKKIIAEIPVGKSPHGIFFAAHAPRI